VPVSQSTNPKQQSGSSPGSISDTGSKESFQVSAPSISLPKGGSAIPGIGEKFGANPVTGTGSMTVPIATSSGCSGLGPNSEREEIGKSFLCEFRERINVKANHEILAPLKDEEGDTNGQR
jgi:hypothetical protein